MTNRVICWTCDGDGSLPRHGSTDENSRCDTCKGRGWLTESQAYCLMELSFGPGGELEECTGDDSREEIGQMLTDAFPTVPDYLITRVLDDVRPKIRA